MRKLVKFNFYLSVWLAILGGIAIFNVPDLMLPDADGLYGPLRNNLLIVTAYILVSEVVLWYFRYLKGSRNEALIMGCTFFLTAGGYQFYGMVNNLPVNPQISLVMGYIALSHIVYFFENRLPLGDKDWSGAVGRRR